MFNKNGKLKQVFFIMSLNLDVATVVGYMVVSRPFMNFGNKKFDKYSHQELMQVKNLKNLPCFLNGFLTVVLQDYYKSGRMLVKLAEAIGRMALAGREMTRLAGYEESLFILLILRSKI